MRASMHMSGNTFKVSKKQAIDLTLASVTLW